MDNRELRERAANLASGLLLAGGVEEFLEAARAIEAYIVDGDEPQAAYTAEPTIAPQRSLCDFSTAMRLLSTGHRMQRAGWNGNGMFVFLTPGSLPGGWPAPFRMSNGLFAEGDAGTIMRLPRLSMRLADGSRLDGWVPSQIDMFAEDWQSVAESA